MKIIYEKKKEQKNLIIHSLDDLKELMKESSCCLFFARKYGRDMYSLFLCNDVLTCSSHRDNREQITEDNIGDFEYFKLDDAEFSAILDEQ